MAHAVKHLLDERGEKVLAKLKQMKNPRGSRSRSWRSIEDSLRPSLRGEVALEKEEGG